jgi:NAD-dependent aldehyde dehydrogenases
VIETTNPDFRLLRDELFGPVVTAYVYPEGKYSETLDLVDRTAPYGLTGAVFARDRSRSSSPTRSSSTRRQLLRQRQADRRGRRPAAVRRSAGVGHERQGRLDVEPDPLGLAATIKETFVPPTDYRYPFLESE